MKVKEMKKDPWRPILERWYELHCQHFNNTMDLSLEPEKNKLWRMIALHLKDPALDPLIARTMINDEDLIIYERD